MKEKKYRSITEVSELLDINSHVIRYWDSKFIGLSTRLNSSKQRFFNIGHIKKLKDLKLTLYTNGKHNYSLDLAKKIINKNKSQQSDSFNNASKEEKYECLNNKNKLRNKKLSLEALKNIRKSLNKIIDM